MSEPTSKKQKRKRPRRKAREEPVYFTVAVEDWDWSYSFGVNLMKDREEFYSDYRHLHLMGKLLRPASVKAETVKLVFLPDDRYNRDQWHRHRAPHVGTLHLRRGHLEGMFSLPADALPAILTMMAAGRIRFAVLHSAKLRYGQAEVQGFRLEMNIDEDDLPPEG